MNSRFAWLRKYVIAALVVASGFAITPLMQQLAYAERGYEAVGGEYGPLVLSFIIAAIIIQTLSEIEAKNRLNEREKSQIRRCERYVSKLYEVRAQTERPELNSTRVREGMCIEIECESLTIIAFAQTDTEETENNNGFYAITVISRRWHK